MPRIFHKTIFGKKKVIIQSNSIILVTLFPFVNISY